MRILIASRYLPWPLNSGGNAAQFSTLKCLAEDHRFTLVCPIFDEAGMAHAKELQVQLPQVKIRAAFCGSYPTPAPPRASFLIRAARRMVRLGRRLLHPPMPPPARHPETPKLPYYPFDPLPEEFISVLQDESKKGVDLYQAEFADMLSLGSWFPKNAPKLFVHHQLHFIYVKRFLETHGENSYSTYLELLMRSQELAYLKDFDGVITFSEQDREALLPYVAPEKIYNSPFPYPLDMDISEKPPSEFDGRFLFIASEEHAPNRDALDWLLACIWPEILRQLPMSRLIIIGNWSESAKARLSSTEVSFTGFVDDLAAVLRGGIMLVPVRIGSGIRVKIMAAMMQAVPVVSTSVGSEGMPLRDGKELLIRDDALEFAGAAVALATHPELYKRLGSEGKVAISGCYSPEKVRQKRNEIYTALKRSSAPPSHPARAAVQM